MKTVIKLVLIYFAMQLLGTLLVAPYTVVRTMTAQPVDQGLVSGIALVLGTLFMGIYLWRTGWLKSDGRLYSPTTPALLGLSLAGGASLIFVEDFVMSCLSFLPDWLEQTFDVLQTGWPGVLGVVLLGPLIEELLFRGAITRVLLQKYSPAKAIAISALVFGVFHLNPVQVVAATMAGVFFAWLYWRTGSVVPGLLVHVLNNGLSVFLGCTRPDSEVDYFSDLLPTVPYFLSLAAAILLLCFSVKLINDKTKER